MVLTALINKSEFYTKTLSNLNFIRNQFLNHLMGVGLVKWAVKNTFLKYLNPNLKLDGKANISDLNNIRNQMTKAEIDHLFGFLCVTIIVIFKIFNQEYIFAGILLIVNILMNLCPSLLQQQNKRRIDKIMTRFKP
ncbi:MAG: hypothetical protein LC127_06165 [Chitinophagales bacterium]|nr:hypothetical protein [Chitinophagales bacterium]